MDINTAGMIVVWGIRIVVALMFFLLSWMIVKDIRRDGFEPEHGLFLLMFAVVCGVMFLATFTHP